MDICSSSPSLKQEEVMKHEWRKKEKKCYLPKNRPEFIEIPEFNFFTIKGEGNPNDPHFPEYIGVLYALSYAVKMSYKSGLAPKDYYDYTVYPLEGVWDLKPEAREKFNGTIIKDDLVFTLMMRQPDFVDEKFFKIVLSLTEKKKPHPLLAEVRFETIAEGPCIQMMHLGSYDDEPASFALMEKFAADNHQSRLDKTHREIYLTDARKVAPEKQKTVLRFRVDP